MSNTIISLTGNDSIIIGGRILNDFADGEVGKIEFPSDVVNVKRGKNGNTIFALNNEGFKSDVTIRILLGGGDDSFLNGQLQSLLNNFSAFQLLTGSFVKNVGDGNTNIIPVTYVMSGGVIKKAVSAMSNADGDVNQSVAEWRFIFANNQRGIG